MKQLSHQILLIGIFLFASICSSVHAEAADLKNLYSSFKEGELKQNELRSMRDQARDKIRKSLEGEARQKAMYLLTEWYQGKSRAIVAQHRQPFVEAAIDQANTGLPEGKKISLGAGSDVYVKDKDGKYILDQAGNRKLNSKHRGWDGDLDLGGSPKATDELMKTLDQFGIKTDIRPGYKDMKQLEVTINTEGMLGPVGSTARQDQISVDARSKETYISESMRNPDRSFKQPGGTAVAVQDHTKKAIKGLKTPASELMKPKNEDVLQGLGKGTLKAANDGKLTDNDLARHLEKVGYDISPQEYREQLQRLKSGHIPEGANITDHNVEKFQQSCKETLGAAAEKSQQLAKQEMTRTQQKITELERQAKIVTDPDETKKLTQQAQGLRKDLVDSKMKLNESIKANAQKISNDPLGAKPDYNYGKQDNIKTRTNTVDLDKIPNKPKNKKPGDIQVKGLAGASKLLDLKGMYDDSMKGVNQALDEEAKGDSSLKTWGKATAYGVWNASGVPGILDAMVRAVKGGLKNTAADYEAEYRKNEGDVSLAKISEISVKNSAKTVGGLLWDMGKGMVEGLLDIPASAGAFLGEMAADQSSEEIEKMEDQALIAQNRVIQIRMAKQREAKVKDKKRAEMIQNEMEALALVQEVKPGKGFEARLDDPPKEVQDIQAATGEKTKVLWGEAGEPTVEKKTRQPQVMFVDVDPGRERMLRQSIAYEQKAQQQRVEQQVESEMSRTLQRQAQAKRALASGLQSLVGGVKTVYTQHKQFEEQHKAQVEAQNQRIQQQVANYQAKFNTQQQPVNTTSSSGYPVLDPFVQRDQNLPQPKTNNSVSFVEPSKTVKDLSSKPPVSKTNLVNSSSSQRAKKLIYRVVVAKDGAFKDPKFGIGRQKGSLIARIEALKQSYGPFRYPSSKGKTYYSSSADASQADRINQWRKEGKVQITKRTESVVLVDNCVVPADMYQQSKQMMSKTLSKLGASASASGPTRWGGAGCYP